jgi:hypothetical protein
MQRKRRHRYCVQRRREQRELQQLQLGRRVHTASKNEPTMQQSKSIPTPRSGSKQEQQLQQSVVRHRPAKLRALEKLTTRTEQPAPAEQQQQQFDKSTAAVVVVPESIKPIDDIARNEVQVADQFAHNSKTHAKNSRSPPLHNRNHAYHPYFLNGHSLDRIFDASRSQVNP